MTSVVVVAMIACAWAMLEGKQYDALMAIYNELSAESMDTLPGDGSGSDTFFFHCRLQRDHLSSI